MDYLAKPIYEIHEFPEQLANLGHNVTFLEFNEIKRKPRPKRHRLISGRVNHQIQVALETPLYTGAIGLDRLLAVITCIPKMLALFRSQKFDVVVLYAVPTYGIQTILLSNFFGVPLIHRALDVPHKIRVSIFEPLIRLAEKFVYKYSPAVSANNPSLAAYCDSVGKRKTLSKVHLPPLDLDELRPSKKSVALGSSLGIQANDQVVTYLGSFFYFSGLPQVIKDFAKQSQSQPFLKLLLIGGGEQEAELRSLVHKLELTGKVIFTGFIPFSQIPSYLALANVAINPMESVISSNLALPHKIFQYLACGVPVISTKLTGIYATLGDDAGVTWVEGPSSVVDAAINLINDKDQLSKQAELGRKSLRTKFEMSKVISDFEKFISQETRAGRY